MSDLSQQPDPQAVLNQPMDLRGLMKLLGARFGDQGTQFLTALPGAYDVGARGLEHLATLLLPPAVAGAMRDARQYVETAPGIRRHNYEDIAPAVMQATGQPYEGPSLLAHMMGAPLPPAQSPAAPVANLQGAGNLQQFLPAYTAPASWPIPNWPAGSYGRQF
jgi:hypothetical protein